MDKYDDDEIEELGVEDGYYDKTNHMSYQASYGYSVELDELSDEQRDLYDLGYNMGAEDYDLFDDEDE